MNLLETAENFENDDFNEFEQKNFLEDFLEVNEVEKAPSMEIQACEISEAFLEIPELQYENWKELGVDERITVLQNFEEEVAKIEYRKESVIKADDLGEGCLGQFSGLTKDITLNEKLIMSDSKEDYLQVLETYFHEGRHAYQYHNLYVEQTESNSVLINAWHINENILGYNSGDYGLFGYEEYYTQPVEVDANTFAEEVMEKLDLR